MVKELRNVMDICTFLLSVTALDHEDISASPYFVHHREQKYILTQCWQCEYCYPKTLIPVGIINIIIINIIIHRPIIYKYIKCSHTVNSQECQLNQRQSDLELILKKYIRGMKSHFIL